MGIFSKNKSRLMLVFNIGSSSVGGALFWTQESGIPRIIFSVTEPILFQNKISPQGFLRLTMQALGIVAGKIHKAGMGKPEEIFCVLSSPWHISQTRIINYKKNTPFVFTAKLAESLIQKEINLFEEEHPSKTIDMNAPNRPIELKNIKTLLNGYETSEPLNQKAEELEMIIFISMSEEQALRKMESEIAKYYHFEKIRFSSFTLSSFTVVRDMQINQENFLLLDIGGEVTNISMTKKNILRESISFPLGRNFFVRGVASYLKCTPGEASSYLSLVKDGHAEDSTRERVSSILDKLKSDWLRQFQESLANLSNDISIPSTIYMTTNEDLVDLFCQTIKSEQFNQYTLTESKFEIIYLDTKVFHGLAVFKEPDIREPSLVIDSIYINRFLNNSAAEKRL